MAEDCDERWGKTAGQVIWCSYDSWILGPEYPLIASLLGSLLPKETERMQSQTWAWKFKI